MFSHGQDYTTGDTYENSVHTVCLVSNCASFISRNGSSAELNPSAGDTKVITYPCTAYEVIKGRGRSPAVEPNNAYHTVLQARPRETASQEHVYETVVS